MWGQILLYLFVVIVCIALVFASAWINRPISHTPLQSFVELSQQAETIPIAFTWEKRNGKFVNYFFNTDGSLEEEVSDKPINYDGLPYEKYPKGLILEENDEGFIVQGIQTPFRCPAVSQWDKDSKSCRVKPICSAEDEGFIRGINQYQMHETRNSLQFHPRVYAVCSTGNIPELRHCLDNTVFNQIDRQPNSVNPCEYFDTCSERANKSRHRQQISNRPLQDNEFYICEDGQSRLERCDVNLVFSSVLGGCIERGICWEQPNGTTIPIENNLNEYIRCENERPNVINCTLGLTTSEGAIQCINPLCSTFTISQWHTNDVVNQPLCMTSCFDGENQPSERCCSGEIKTYRIPIPLDQVYIDSKSDLIEPIDYYDHQLETLGLTAYQCQHVEFKDIVNNPIVEASYNQHFPSFNFNIIQNRPEIFTSDVIRTYFVMDRTIYSIFQEIVESVTDATNWITGHSGFFQFMRFIPELSISAIITKDSFLHVASGTANFEIEELKFAAGELLKDVKYHQNIIEIQNINKSNQKFKTFIYLVEYPYPLFSILFAQHKDIASQSWYNIMVVTSMFEISIYQVKDTFFLNDLIETLDVSDGIFTPLIARFIPDAYIDELKDLNFRSFNAKGRQLQEGPFALPFYYLIFDFTNFQSIVDNVRFVETISTTNSMEELFDIMLNSDFGVPNFEEFQDGLEIKRDFSFALNLTRLQNGNIPEPPYISVET